MFIGHYAPALAAATWRRAPRLGPLFIAAQLTDIAFCLLTLAGVEHYAIEPWYTAMSPLFLYDVRWSHSLLGTLALAAGSALAVRLAGGSTRTGWIGAAVAAAHWPLDLLSHAPDLTLAGDAHRLGFGLWNHPYVEMPLELGLTFVGLTFYLNNSRARDRRGDAALALLAVALVGFQLAQWLRPMAQDAIDPAPRADAYAALATYTILTVLAWWTGTMREACPAPPPLAGSPAPGGER